ncbi:MAG: putative CtpA-like serine protease [Chloroflexota bacterium]|nr:S41 family peptidase [Dehalococcoidia bacterium]CAI8267254.1 MAG: putative CtpA-like serine protease [Chloroflexota bacterium]
MKIPQPIKYILVALGSLIIGGTSSAAIIIFLTGTPSFESPEDLPPEFSRLTEVWYILKRDHFDRKDMDSKILSDGAIRGMLLAMDDPYASFLTAEQFEIQSQDYKGFFEGIGAHVSMRDNRIVIVAPIPGSPAEAAGILAGDIILGIDGDSTQGLTLLEAVSRIRGERGTLVVLSILHEGEDMPQEISVERNVIKLDSVQMRMMTGGVGVFTVTEFNANTYEQLENAFTRFQTQGGKGMILDLRNNPGGLLNSVFQVADAFIDSKLIVYEVDSKGNRKNWNASRGGFALDVPLIVLTNRYSASASEVLAGALMDHNRAIIVGDKTFGKGSVNTLEKISDGSGIYFTIAKWYTPDGKLIEGEGLVPDVDLTQMDTLESGQDALDVALNIMKNDILGK